MVSRNRDGVDETLAIFRSGDAQYEPLTAPEVADRLGCSRQEAADRLDRLVDQGILETKAFSSDEQVWWVTGPTTDHTDDNQGVRPSLVEDVAAAGEVGVVVVDDDSRVAWLNDWAERYFGVERSAVVGRDERELVRDVLADRAANPDRFARDLLRSDDGGDYGVGEFECQITANGERRWLRHYSQPIDTGEYAGGRVEFYYDVTPEKRRGEDRREREEQFHSLVQATEEYAIFLLDEDGTVVSWNPGAERIKGYEESEIVGEHFSTFYTDEDVADGVPARNLERARETGSVEDEGWRVRADGSRFWANVTITAITDDDGEVSGFAKVTRDMTDRRERERRLQEERNLLEKIFDAVPSSIGVVSPDGTFVRANERADQRLGTDELDRSRYEVGVRDVYDAAGEFVPVEERPYMRVFETGEPVRDWHCQIELPDQGRRWVSINAVPLTADDGSVERVVVCGDDVSQLKEQAERLERQRDELESELDEVFERVSEGFFALDENWQFAYVNDRAAEYLGRPEGELLGASIWDEFESVADTAFEENYREAMETQEPVSFEAYYPPNETWFDVDAYPSSTGLSVYFGDATARKERQRQLERYERIVDNLPVGVYRNTPGPDGEFVEMNDELAAIFDADSVEELMEYPVSDLYVDSEQRAEFSERLERDGVVEDWEVEQETLDGERIWISITAIRTEKDGEVYFDGIVQDVTERKERERELKQYETLFEESQDVNAVIQPDGTYSYLTPSAESVLGYDPEELVGESAFEYVHPDDRERIWEEFGQVVEDPDYGPRVEMRFERADGSWAVLEAHARNLLDDPQINGIVAYTRDVTERKERERELEARLDQQDVVADFGRRALENPGLDDLFDEVTERVAEVLDGEYCKVLDLDRDSEELRLRAGVGWEDGYAGETTVPIDRESQAGYALLTDDPVVVEDMEAETRFTGPDLLIDHAVESGISVVIGSPEDPWGILGVHDTEPNDFSDHDALFVQSVANILASAIDRRDNEVELENQREHLAALNNLHSVVRDINDALVEQSTREEIERAVCERLADSESYRFAWVGDVDARSKEVEPRVEVGVDGYVETVDMSVDPDDPRGQGPTGRAARTKEIQVTNDALADPAYEPWHSTAEEYGFRSSAAIPIVYRDTLYGVLGVYTERVGAFTEEEREVVAQLGEIIGHAIAALDRKRALMSDEVVEIEIRMENVLDEVGYPGTMDGRVEFEETVSVGDGTYLQYGTTDGGAFETMTSLIDVLPHWEEVSAIETESEETQFELRLSEPPVISMVAAKGGYIDAAAIEDGTMHMTVHLPTTVDVRQVIDEIKDVYSSAEMVTRQQVDPTDSRERVEHELTEELTDRQRAALEASYHAGFFEWPRESSGEDVADSLDVSAPTFHQHLRKAQQKLFESLLE